jgi:hypothetical protein
VPIKVWADNLKGLLGKVVPFASFGDRGSVPPSLPLHCAEEIMLAHQPNGWWCLGLPSINPEAKAVKAVMGKPSAKADGH